jgi:hypothetical protein
MSAHVLLSRRRVITGEWSMDATDTDHGGGVHTLAIPAGEYYLDSDVPGESLCTVMDTLLDVAFGPDTFTVAYDLTTGKITWTIAGLAGTWSVAFNEDSFAKWVGFAAAGGGWGATAVATQVSTNACRGAIHTRSGRSMFRHEPMETGYYQRRAMSGKVASVSTDATLYTGNWQHDFEPEVFSAAPLESGCWDALGTVVPWTWSDFFAHHGSMAQSVQPFHFYEDPTAGIASYEQAWVLANAKNFDPAPFEESNFYHWIVPLEVSRYVP